MVEVQLHSGEEPSATIGLTNGHRSSQHILYNPVRKKGVRQFAATRAQPIPNGIRRTSNESWKIKLIGDPNCQEKYDLFEGDFLR
jgi:hypothetical protein